jgi:hypothetical protein
LRLVRPSESPIKAEVLDDFANKPRRKIIRIFAENYGKKATPFSVHDNRVPIRAFALERPMHLGDVLKFHGFPYEKK